MGIASQPFSAGQHASNWHDPTMATTLDTHAAIKRFTAAANTTGHADAIVKTVS